MTAATRRDDTLDPDTLAALEEQREFLLVSLADLEREYAAGDIDDVDYEGLKDDYTARAAVVIRSIDRRRVAFTSRAARSSRPRRVAWIVGVAVVALLAGILVRDAAGRREMGETISGGVSGSTRTLLARADMQFGSGEAELAIGTYDEVLEIDPANVEALTYQGALRYRGGDVDEALAQLDQALQVDETYVDAWSFKVILLAEEGRSEEALTAIGELVAAGGSDIALAAAQQVLQAGRPVESLQIYDAVLVAEPENAVALAYRGWTISMAGLDEEALVYLDRAAAADPALPDAHAFRMIVLNRMGRTDEAIEALAAFDATDPPPEMQAIVDASGLRDELSG